MPSTRSAPQPPAKVSRKKEKKAVKKKPTPPKARVASEESDGSEDGVDREVEIARPAPAALATVESIEKSIAEQQRELARLKAKAVLERRMAALAEEITLLNDKQGMAASLAKTAKVSSADKKSKKRARVEAVAAQQSSEDDSSDSSADELDLGTDDGTSVDSDEEERKTKTPAVKKGDKLSPKLTLRHWRRQAKTLGVNGQMEMKVLLRILQGQQRVISQTDVKAMAFELQLLYLKHTDGAVVAERFRINTSSAAGNGQDGALDQKQVRLAQKQSISLLAAQVPKNDGGALKTQRPRKKAGGNQLSWNKWAKPPLLPTRPSAPELRCFKCDKLGHRAAQCTQKSKGEKDGNKSA